MLLLLIVREQLFHPVPWDAICLPPRATVYRNLNQPYNPGDRGKTKHSQQATLKEKKMRKKPDRLNLSHGPFGTGEP